MGVVVAIKNERPDWLRRFTNRCGDVLDDGLENLDCAYPGLRRGHDAILAREANNAFDLVGDVFRLCRGKVDLVDDGNDGEVMFDCLVGVRQRLCLDALGRIHDEQCTFARRQRPADLIGKVDVAWSVDQVELVVQAIQRVVEHPDGFRLDRDALLTLQVHLVKDLFGEVAFGNRPGHL